MTIRPLPHRTVYMPYTGITTSHCRHAKQTGCHMKLSATPLSSLRRFLTRKTSHVQRHSAQSMHRRPAAAATCSVTLPSLGP